jgi:hypothetical protein
LPAAAVDHHEVGKRLVFLLQAAIAAGNHFLHRAEVVVADETLDGEAAVLVLVRPAFGEMHH